MMEQERKGSVTLKVARYIQKNIQSGAWKVGELIPSENTLCQELGVSRVSVRSALKQFIALDILQSVHGKGTFLLTDDLSLFTPAEGSKEVQTRESLDTMREVLEFRSMVEPLVCEAVVPKATPELVAQLETLLETMRASVGKSKRFVQADVDFHMALCRATGNSFTVEMMETVFKKRSGLNLMLNLANGYYGGIYYHSLLLDAIKKRNAKHARTLMYEHLCRGIDDLEVDNEVEEP